MIGQVLKRLLRQPAFVAAVVVLAVAAAGLNAAVQFLKLNFQKKPVPLAVYGRPLATLPAELGPWRQVSQDAALDAEVQDVLGTDQYVMREYADERVVGKKTIDKLRDLRAKMLTETDPAALARLEDELNTVYGTMRRDHLDGVVNVALTYYTGMVDTVAHVPDRCVVADGYQPKPSDNDYPTWNIGAPGATNDNSASRTMQVRFMNFEDQTQMRRLPRSVAYFFQVNGQYMASHLDVRRELQDLTQRYGYYAKVELMTLLDDRDRSAAVMSDFLAHAVPEIERILPDWERVQRDAAAAARGGGSADLRAAADRQDAANVGN